MSKASNSKDFLMFSMVKYSPRLHLLDEKYRKHSNIEKYYYNLKDLFSI